MSPSFGADGGLRFITFGADFVDDVNGSYSGNI